MLVAGLQASRSTARFHLLPSATQYGLGSEKAAGLFARKRLALLHVVSLARSERKFMHNIYLEAEHFYCHPSMICMQMKLVVRGRSVRHGPAAGVKASGTL